MDLLLHSRAAAGPLIPTTQDMETLFWLMMGLAGWCYAGYPLLMFARARWFGEDPKRAVPVSGWPAVSVVVAVRNEAAGLAARVENLLGQEYAGALEVLVVCNGCTDATEAEAARLARADGRVRVLVSAAEEGKAGALNLGVAAATAPFVVFADGRQRFRADAVRELVSGFVDPAVGVVSGRTVQGESALPSVHGVGMYWGFETRLRLAESRTGSMVQAQGAIYAIRRELFEEIPPNTILDDVYLPARIALRGYRLVLNPDAIAEDVPAAAQGDEYRRKLRTMTGNLQLLRLLPALLSPRANPLFFRFVSHKLLRVATPLLLLGVLVLGGFLPLVPYRLFAAAQLAGYVLGTLGLVYRTRWLSVPAAVVLVHAAVLHALLTPHRDARTVWASAAAGPAVTR